MNREKHDELNELNLNEQERATMERMLAEFRRSANDQAEQPELFWASMKTRIAARMREHQSHRGLGWAATLAAVSAMVVFMAVPSHSPQHGITTPTATPAVATVSTSDDESLLRSIADTTNSDVPKALAPATVLTSEMDRGLKDGKGRNSGRDNQ